MYQHAFMLKQLPRVAQFQARSGVGSLLKRNRTKNSRVRPCSSIKDKASSQSDDYTKGQLYLLAVSGLWGSYNPTLRLIYNSTDFIDPIAIAAIRGVLQVTLLGTFVMIVKYLNNNKKTPNDKASSDNDSIEDDDQQQQQPTSTSSAASTSLLPLSLQASLEIGLYNTVGTIAQTFALSNTSATRGAFLIQASIIFTPLLATLFGPPPSRAAWIACCTALVAAILVTQDSLDISTDTITSSITSTAAAATTATADSIASHPLLNIDPPTTVIGDVQTLIAALFYSLATVRIPRYASKMSPLTLAFGKSAFLATTAVGTALLETMSHTNVSSSSSNSIEHMVTSLTRLWPEWAASSSSTGGGGGDSIIVWVLLIWSAFGPGSLAAFLMVKGQSLVSATDAQIAFATVPLWSAVLALGMVQESVGWLTWVGGGMMIGAGLYAALEGRKAAAAARIER
jgi:drug/metabolite transporter (DMT)-like permease